MIGTYVVKRTREERTVYVRESKRAGGMDKDRKAQEIEWQRE